jgi:hypothetical protein
VSGLLHTWTAANVHATGPAGDHGDGVISRRGRSSAAIAPGTTNAAAPRDSEDNISAHQWRPLFEDNASRRREDLSRAPFLVPIWSRFSGMATSVRPPKDYGILRADDHCFCREPTHKDPTRRAWLWVRPHYIAI